MLCCVEFLLPSNIRLMLKKIKWISERSYKFKSAKYTILTNLYTQKRYFVQLVDEPMPYVSTRLINASTKIGIVVTSKNFIAEKPQTAVRQICRLLKDDKIFTPTMYPTGFMPAKIYKFDDVGEGIYPWPSRVFAPYVDITAWPTYMIADEAEITGVRYYNLGFVVSQSATDCSPSWGTYYPIDQIPGKEQIPRLRSLGGDITVSFGGAANIPIHICAPDIETIKQIYRTVIDMYDLRRIDLDLEGAWTEYREANERNAIALSELQEEYKLAGKPFEIWVTLPILRTGLVPSGEFIVAQMVEAGVNLTGVNAMTMDYGPPYPDMGQAAIDAITALQLQLSGFYPEKTDEELWRMVGATPMIGENDIPGEVFGLEDAVILLDFVNSVSIGQLSMWSSNRDNSDATGIPQEDNEFTSIFRTYDEV